MLVGYSLDRRDAAYAVTGYPVAGPHGAVPAGTPGLVVGARPGCETCSICVLVSPGGPLVEISDSDVLLYVAASELSDGDALGRIQEELEHEGRDAAGAEQVLAALTGLHGRLSSGGGSR